MAHAGVTVDINIGNPAPVVVAPPPTPRFVIREAPLFIFSPALGFYVSVGSPYDIVDIGNFSTFTTAAIGICESNPVVLCNTKVKYIE